MKWEAPKLITLVYKQAYGQCTSGTGPGADGCLDGISAGGGAPEMVVRMALARIAQDAAEAAPLDQVQHDNPLFLLYI